MFADTASGILVETSTGSNCKLNEDTIIIAVSKQIAVTIVGFILFPPVVQYYIIKHYCIAILESFIYYFHMVRINKNIIIGLTTFNHEFLNISISGLAHIGKNIILVVYNDNPCRKLTHKMVRRLGFRGQLHIINTDENVGVIRARVAILEYIKKNKLVGNWFMFANDDDVVLNAVLPGIDDNIFAVMGNAVVIRNRILDVLRIMSNPNDYTIDSVDTQLRAPHIAISGTLVRTKHILEFGDFLSTIMPQIINTVSDTPFIIPADIMMWNMFVEYMRIYHPKLSPIYMNQTNYLMTKLNNTRYPTQAQCDGLVMRAVALVGAAPRGNE